MTCPTCGKRRYLTRKTARQYARRNHPGDHLSAYKCGDFWHLGHLPDDVTKLGIARSAIRHKKRRNRA